MDRFLRSLLISSAGPGSMDADRTLSDIARSVLVDNPEGDAKGLREKAGLLALLNLLGIVEAFYGEMPQGARSQTGAKSAGAAGAAKELALATSGAETPSAAATPTTPAANAAGDGPFSMVSSLSKLLAGGGPAGAIDPALVAGMLALVSAMAKARPGLAKPAGEAARDTTGETTSAAQAVVAPPGDEPGQTGGSEKPAPVVQQGSLSPLQQILGIDPKVLTLVLNVVADLMKSRSLEAKEKAPEPGPDRQEKAETPAAVGAGGKDIVRAGLKRRAPASRLYHKPGLGIYRTVPEAARSDLRPDARPDAS